MDMKNLALLRKPTLVCTACLIAKAMAGTLDIAPDCEGTSSQKRSVMAHVVEESVLPSVLPTRLYTNGLNPTFVFPTEAVLSVK